MTHNEKVNFLFSVMDNDTVIPAEILENVGVENIKNGLRSCNTKQDIINFYNTLV